MRAAILAGPLLLVAVLASAGQVAAADEDPWKGKSREEIVDLLGSPQKVKNPGQDGETLTYKAYRIDPTQVGTTGLRLIPVPGVGVIGIKPPEGGADTDVTIGPTEQDRSGRPNGSGGLTMSDKNVSSTYNRETGRWETDQGSSGHSPTAGKVKLSFVLDAAGRVRDWSVSGKK